MPLFLCFYGLLLVQLSILVEARFPGNSHLVLEGIQGEYTQSLRPGKRTPFPKTLVESLKVDSMKQQTPLELPGWTRGVSSLRKAMKPSDAILSE